MAPMRSPGASMRCCWAHWRSAHVSRGSTYNYAALYLRMINAFQVGMTSETTARSAASSVDMIAVLLKHGVLRTGKATMAMMGVDCGPTRSPVPPLVGEELNTVPTRLRAAGFLRLCSGTGSDGHDLRSRSPS